MSPEQVEGLPVDARSEIFAFGLVLYEMLTGRQAFDAPSQPRLIAQILERDPPRLTDSGLDVPSHLSHLSHLVDRCLAKNPEDRWQSASDVTQELEWSRSSVTDPSTDGSHARNPAPVAETDRPAETSTTTRNLRISLLLAGFVAAATALYLNNPSFRDALLYPLLAIIGALPFALVVASLEGTPIKTAARQISKTLGSLGGMAPQSFEGQHRALGVR